MKAERCSPAIRQHVEPCGCVVTERPGHVNTKMCETHARTLVVTSPYAVCTGWASSGVTLNPGDVVTITAPADNLDLVGG